MRLISFLSPVLITLALCACNTTAPRAGLPEPVTIKMEQTNTSQTLSGDYPMLYAPPQTTTPVPICERFITSLSAAEQKINQSATGGYQPYQLYTP